MHAFRQRAFSPVLVLVGLVGSMISSLGAPLLPEIARSYDASLGTAQWSLTGPILVAAIASPILGRLGDGRHRRRVLIGSLVLVIIGGVLAATASSLGVLIGGRAMQGLGQASAPLTMAAARDHLPGGRATRMIALLSVVNAAGVGLGFPVTGLIAGSWGISAAYWVGVGLCVIALAFVLVVMPRSRPQEHRRLDAVGAGLIGGGLLALLLGIEQATSWGWAAASTLALLAAGVVVLGLWVAHELRTTDPLVDLRLLRHRTVLGANVSGFALAVSMYVSMIATTQFVQSRDVGLSESVFVSGLTLLPTAVLSLLSTRMIAVVERRTGLRGVVPVGAVAVALSSAFFAFTLDALWEVFVTSTLLGVGFGLTFGAMPGLIVRSVPPAETGSSLGFYQVSRFVGFSIGSAVAAALLVALGSAGEPTLGSYRATMLIGAGLALVAGAVAWIVPGRATGAPATSAVAR